MPRFSGSGRLVYGLLVFLALLARRAGAESVPEAARPADLCAARSWVLDGAAARPGGDVEADLPEEWRPRLQAIARCLENPDAARACLVVQGQFDALGFTPGVVATFGSLEAAQQARARGRAARVLGELTAAGAPDTQLREASPLRAPTYRGVSIVWREECLPPPPELGAEDRRVIEEARQLVEAHRVEEEGRPVETPGVTSVVESPAPSGPSPFFLEGALHASAGMGDPATVIAPGLRVAIGLEAGPIVARAGIGGAVAARDEQRLSGEAFLGVAYRLLPWIELGPVAGGRVGGPDPPESWLERSWFAGAEATECPWSLWDGVDFCLQQAVLPFGRQVRRGEVEDGRIFRIPAEANDRTRLELSVALRNEL